jgi:hydroxymethylbilane synthase
MINGDVDIAVHSMKDVLRACRIVQAAVLERANTLDILVQSLDFLNNGTIATGSLRRQAQWLNKYPNHKVLIYAEVNTRKIKRLGRCFAAETGKNKT